MSNLVSVGIVYMVLMGSTLHILAPDLLRSAAQDAFPWLSMVRSSPLLLCWARRTACSQRLVHSFEDAGRRMPKHPHPDIT